MESSSKLFAKRGLPWDAPMPVSAARPIARDFEIVEDAVYRNDYRRAEGYSRERVKPHYNGRACHPVPNLEPKFHPAHLVLRDDPDWTPPEGRYIGWKEPVKPVSDEIDWDAHKERDQEAEHAAWIAQQRKEMAARRAKS